MKQSTRYRGAVSVLILAIVLVPIGCNISSIDEADAGAEPDADFDEPDEESPATNKNKDKKEQQSDPDEEEVISDLRDPDYPCIGVRASDLSAIEGTCTFPKDESNLGSTTMVLDLEDDEIVLIAKDADGMLAINGRNCGDEDTASDENVMRLEINGSGGDNTVILDFSNGPFAQGSATNASHGIAVDLKNGDLDTLKIKGSANTGEDEGDNCACGKIEDGTAYGCVLNEDSYLDITAVDVEELIVSLGPGDDSFSAAGAAIAPEITAPVDIPITVCAGAGDDVFDQGSAAATIDERGETISGGDGVDTVDYSLRENAVNVTVSHGHNDDGEADERDDIKDIEQVLGGNGDDTLTQEPESTEGISFWGNGGDDVLTGGLGDDILWGGPGDDTFVTFASIDGDDTYYGEDGKDSISYAERDNDLTIIMDGETASGEQGEADVLSVDIEILVGGSGNDIFTGNDVRNSITGGKGDDVLSGLAGDDVFIEESTAANSGRDTYWGGADVDTVTYENRTDSGEGVYLVINNAPDSGKNDGSEGDTIACDVENLIGTSLDDELTGHEGACASSDNIHDNQLSGGAGVDVIIGGDGDDIVGGDSGNDRIECGPGIDICLDTVAECEASESCEM